jgi:hypothetical protein
MGLNCSFFRDELRAILGCSAAPLNCLPRQSAGLPPRRTFLTGRKFAENSTGKERSRGNPEINRPGVAGSSSGGA